MTQDEYFKQTRVFFSRGHELTWFSAEISYYAAAGRTLDSLSRHLRLGCGIDKDKILQELASLLWAFTGLCSCTMSHGDFLAHNWDTSKEMVPAGVNGCANSILNMIRSGETSKRVHFLANACSHLGFSFETVAQKSIEILKKEMV